MSSASRMAINVSTAKKNTTKIKSKRKMLNMKQEERIMKKNNSITHTHKRKKNRK